MDEHSGYFQLPTEYCKPVVTLQSKSAVIYLIWMLTADGCVSGGYTMVPTKGNTRLNVG